MNSPKSMISINHVIDHGHNLKMIHYTYNSTPPIYLAVCSNYTTKDTYISFELGDEMELLEQMNSSELRINHLRSGRCGIVPKTSVQLDEATPLRLAVEDIGIIQRYLMQYSTPDAYFIRRSTTQPKALVMNISQFNGQYNTSHWNYLIRIHASNNFFYFSQKEQLKHLFFSSFQQIICNEHVRSIIPLTEILPYSVQFDEKIWRIPFSELKIEHSIGKGQFGEVYRAKWHQTRRIIPVAVKRLYIRGIKRVIQREIETMKKLINLYVVTLCGVSQNTNTNTNEIFIVTELMENGDLKSWLKQ